MVTAYPVAGKAKSVEICRAFIQGCGGAIAHNPSELMSGAAFFYGVDASNQHIFDQVLREGREFYYCDNAYFDKVRQSYFRVTCNRLQHEGIGKSDGQRFAALGISMLPWRTSGDHVVVCPQSDHFMRNIAKCGGDWLAKKVKAVVSSQATLVHLRDRPWSPDKAALSASLEDDLRGALGLITYSSAAAVTAVLNGIPVSCDESCAAWIMSSNIFDTESKPDVWSMRQEWASVLADNQWTLDEMRAGLAWKMLHA